jgi:hypothetical protein
VDGDGVHGRATQPVVEDVETVDRGAVELFPPARRLR